MPQFNAFPAINKEGNDTQSMGKSLSRDQRKNSKYTTREEGRKFKEIQQYSSLSTEPKPPKPKAKWRPRSEVDAE